MMIFLTGNTKMKSVNPRLATGIIGIIIFILSFLVEILIRVPLISKYILYVTIFAIVPVFIFYPKFASKYDKNNNDNAKLYILGLSLGIILIILAYICFSL